MTFPAQRRLSPYRSPPSKRGNVIPELFVVSRLPSLDTWSQRLLISRLPNRTTAEPLVAPEDLDGPSTRFRIDCAIAEPRNKRLTRRATRSVRACCFMLPPAKGATNTSSFLFKYINLWPTVNVLICICGNQTNAYWASAAEAATTLLAPEDFSAVATASIVAPVVTTSSTTIIRNPCMSVLPH